MLNTPIARRIRSLLMLPLALVLPAAAAAQHFPDDDDLRIMLRYLVEDGKTPGAMLGVLEADGSTRIVSYGSAGADARPLGPRSVFEIGSINKTFTATLLADMVARGEVALTDPVSIYLPEDVAVPSRGGREITLQDLATHTSGLPRLPDNYLPRNLQDPYADYTIETLYAFLSGHELRRDPGAEYEYSNLGFGLLGHALARAARKSYRDLLRERVLEPLGMDMTGYALEGDVAEWMTQGHAGGAAVSYWFGTEAIDGAGGLRSSVEDMLKYLKANVGPPATDLERAMRAAHEVRVPTDEAGSGHGLAWATLSTGRRRIVTHSGGTGGFRSVIAFDPQRRIGTVLLTNTGNLEDNLATELLYFDPPPPAWNAHVDSSVLARCAGRYEGTSGGTEYHVRLEDEGYLTYQPGDRPRARLYAKSDSSFYLMRAPWSFTFQTDADGKVVGMVMEVDEREPTQPGLKRTARKVEDDGPPPAAAPANAGALMPRFEAPLRSAMTRQAGTVSVPSRPAPDPCRAAPR